MSDLPPTKEISLDDGKYKIKRDGERLIALRYDETWRDLTGDNLIYWLVTEYEGMKAQISGYRQANSSLKAELATMEMKIDILKRQINE